MNNGKNYTPRPSREVITRESDPAGRWSSKFPDMVGYKSQGGGFVPDDYTWNTNPKQFQEEMTPERLAADFQERVIPKLSAPPAHAAALPEGAAKPALPEGAKPAHK